MWTNEGFYDKSWCSPRVSIEFLFVFVGFGRTYWMGTIWSTLVHDDCKEYGFSTWESKYGRRPFIYHYLCVFFFFFDRLFAVIFLYTIYYLKNEQIQNYKIKTLLIHLKIYLYLFYFVVQYLLKTKKM